jgi:hypothetical protein
MAFRVVLWFICGALATLTAMAIFMFPVYLANTYSIWYLFLTFITWYPALKFINLFEIWIDKIIKW